MMAQSVNDGFLRFHTWLTPSSTETAAAKSHRASIQARLKADFAITRFFRTGSFGNGTSIRGFSDVDYFASIPAAHQRTNSATMLKVVKDALADRFPHSDVRIDSPAIVVPFGSAAEETTEVVPVYFVSKDIRGRHKYKMPDGAGGWLTASPDRHNTFVQQQNGAHGNRVKPLIRFLKAWRYYRDVPIRSFYLELRTAKYAEAESSIVYSWDIVGVLRLLWRNQLAAMQDPEGVSGLIQPCATQHDKNTALDELEKAVERAEKALEAEKEGRDEVAFYWWNVVFAGRFPAYK